MLTVAESNAPIPANILHLIKSKGFVQRAVAERAGFTPQQFSDMLNGRKIIKPCDILAISDAIGVNVGDLFADAVQNSA